MDFKGIFPPVITPFNSDGTINEKKFIREIKVYAKAKTAGLVIGGSVGEGPYITDEEMGRLIFLAKRYVNKGQLIICGVMRLSLKYSINTCLCVESEGADAALVSLPPYYNMRLTDNAIVDFYVTLAKSIQIPVIVYNLFSFSVINCNLINKMRNFTNNIIGIKETIGGLDLLSETLSNVEDDFNIYAATDDKLSDCLRLGSAGVISSLATLFPIEINKMWESYLSGDFYTCSEIQCKLNNMWCVFDKDFPFIPQLKFALKCMGRDVGVCRYCNENEMNKYIRKKIKSEFKKQEV